MWWWRPVPGIPNSRFFPSRHAAESQHSTARGGNYTYICGADCTCLWRFERTEYSAAFIPTTPRVEKTSLFGVNKGKLSVLINPPKLLAAGRELVDAWDVYPKISF